MTEHMTVTGRAVLACWANLQKCARAFQRESSQQTEDALELAALEWTQTLGTWDNVDKRIARLRRGLDTSTTDK